ncbi:MAG: hypothetical protein HKP29_13290 [Silicimonas sp.]|nr:hypothetical protein [Silicimonas sp.]
MEKKLVIRLIGAFSATDGEGNPFVLAGRKDRAVLAFLAAHPARPIARERLVELIWPEAADGAGRASLRQSLSTIRKAIPQSDPLLVDRDTVAFSLDCATTDVKMLEDGSRSERIIGNMPLANGEAFLDDLGGISAEFDTWRATEHSRIVSLVSDLVDGVARNAEGSGDINKAVAALSQLVSLDPLNEASQRRYMRALIASGQANSAIRRYQMLEKLLQDELGVTPEQATRAVLTEAKERAGQGAVKGSDHPVAATQPAPSEDAVPELVVYRFRDLSDDADTRQFAEGLSDSIAGALSLVSGLIVVSRPDTSRPNGADADPTEARERFALHGNVRKTGHQIRVGARLIGQPSGRVFWAEDYDRTLDDVLTIQDEITQRIAVELRIKLSEGEKIRVLANYTKNLQVWTRLMRADVLINTLVEEDNIQAQKLLKEALEIDPACAAAWGELADSFIGDCMAGRHARPKSEYLDEAMRAAQMALEVDPSFTHALNNISFVEMFQGDYSKASETSRKALAAAPRNPEIGANSAYVLVFCGHTVEAQQIIRRAIEATPIPPMWYVTVDGICFYVLGQYDAAIETLEAAVRLVPESALARPYLVGALMEAGAADRAERIAAEIYQVQPDFALSDWPGADFSDPVLSERLKDSLIRAGVKP